VRVLRRGGCLALSDFVPTSTDATTLWLGRGLHRVIEAGYGKQSAEWPRGGYREMARLAGLEVLADRDITPHTMPTYAALRLVMSGAALSTRWLRLAIRVTEWLSRARLVRYRLLAFQKP
jgi:hypothetical protein